MAELRLESFPFDSDFDGYDDYGYPVFDRAVGARTFRYSLERVFADGVFGTPASAFQIAKASSGLNVTIKPGLGVIRGAMGGILGDPITLQLDTAAPQGNVAYAVMLRCDDNDDRRSMYLAVVKGDASASPQPPAPTDTEVIKDLRLGYVVVPSGSTDLSNATVTNEKGLDVCPYAAPFAEIDLSEVVTDAKNQATEELNSTVSEFNALADMTLADLQQSVDANLGLLESALDDTTAGYLQNQINNMEVDYLSNAEILAIWNDH